MRQGLLQSAEVNEFGNLSRLKIPQDHNQGVLLKARPNKESIAQESYIGIEFPRMETGNTSGSLVTRRKTYRRLFHPLSLFFIAFPVYEVPRTFLSLSTLSTSELTEVD